MSNITINPHPAQAVAWHTDDHLTDKSATTYDPVVAERWRTKGWPVTPHYLAPQPPSIPEPSDAEVEALVAAARRVLDKAWEFGEDEPHFVALDNAVDALTGAKP